MLFFPSLRRTSTSQQCTQTTPMILTSWSSYTDLRWRTGKTNFWRIIHRSLKDKFVCTCGVTARSMIAPFLLLLLLPIQRTSKAPLLQLLVPPNPLLQPHVSPKRNLTNSSTPSHTIANSSAPSHTTATSHTPKNPLTTSHTLPQKIT